MRRDEGARLAHVVEGRHVAARRGRHATDATIPREIVPSTRIDEVLRDACDGRRCVFVAGLPGAGKSLLVRRAAAIAQRSGRSVQLLRWDVARLAFDTPEILARHPEVGGVTDAAIRVAAGRWARLAVRRWADAHGAADLLIGETPLVGERFASLARPAEDRAEALLASPATLFVVPVPTAAVRARIEAARERDTSGPVGERDRASAAPHLVRWHWDDLVAVALALGAAATPPRGYDAGLCARTFERLLSRRHAQVVAIDEIFDADTTARVADPSEIVPSADEVAAAMTEVDAMPRAGIERAVAEWYRM
ncbi:MAG: ATP-binding protein [Chloroflexota bacterium]|nr:ATP-binding protein [Chloroflexota bacterium]